MCPTRTQSHRPSRTSPLSPGRSLEGAQDTSVGRRALPGPACCGGGEEAIRPVSRVLRTGGSEGRSPCLGQWAQPRSGALGLCSAPGCPHGQQRRTFRTAGSRAPRSALSTDDQSKGNKGTEPPPATCMTTSSTLHPHTSLDSRSCVRRRLTALKTLQRRCQRGHQDGARTHAGAAPHLHKMDTALPRPAAAPGAGQQSGDLGVQRLFRESAHSSPRLRTQRRFHGHASTGCPSPGVLLRTTHTRANTSWGDGAVNWAAI